MRKKADEEELQVGLSCCPDRPCICRLAFQHERPLLEVPILGALPECSRSSWLVRIRHDLVIAAASQA